MSEPFDVSRFFSNLRLDEKTHLGLGDIRLTVADKVNICVCIAELEADLVEARAAISLIQSQAGICDAGVACRGIIKTAEEYFAQQKGVEAR